MGAFFGSIHVRTDNSDLVRTALEQVAQEADCKFLMGPPVEGWISVFPSGSGQDDQISGHLAKHLPNDIFQFLVHDDDIFIYCFYRDGRLIDRYNSSPDYFEGFSDVHISEGEKQACRGRPELFQDLLPAANSLSELKKLLAADKEEYVFENERMAQFVELLGLSNALSSYEDLQSGERDEIEGWEQFIHIENQMESAEDYNSRGEAKLAKGDPAGALADFNKALELNPALVAAQENRVRAERAQSDRGGISAETWNQIGSFNKGQGDLDNAIIGFNKAIELDPNMAEAWHNRGRVKKDKGDQDGALADYNRAIELKPDMAAAYNNRGLLKKAKKDLVGALADYDRAIELRPGLAAAYNNRGELKRGKGDLGGALADFDKAIELKPDLATAYNNRGLLRQARGDMDGALADFSKAIVLKPNMAAGYSNRGKLKRAMADLDGALVDYDRAILLNPGQALFYAFRGEAKFIKGNLDDALSDYNKALELQLDAPEIYINRGEVKRAKKDFDGALADYNRALELQPNSAEAYNNRGLVKKVKGDLEGALADMNRASELKPGSAQVYSNRAEVRQAKGDLEGALADFEKALELKPDMTRTRELLDALKRVIAAAGTATVASAGAGLKKILKIENSLALRTDFSNEAAWVAVCAAIKDPNNEFEANLDFVSDPEYAALKPEQLAMVLPEGSALTFALIIDDIALSNSEHPILVVDLHDELGRTFRVIPSAVWMVENNLTIANMGFAEFADAVDEDGIYRGV